MFTPPFCPNPKCYLHFGKAPPWAWYALHGQYTSFVSGSVQRYRCLVCGKTFSTRTFSIEYFSKKTVDLDDLRDRHDECMSLRGIARSMALSTGTIQNRLDRLSRQAMAVHATLLPQINTTEPVCIDGFVSFDGSQFFPNEVTIAITKESNAVLDFSHATHRRSGRMTDAQKRKAKQLYKGFPFEKDPVSRTFKDVFDTVAFRQPPECRDPLTVITDQKKEYRRTILRSEAWKTRDAEHRIEHIQISSTLPRDGANPLFASNYIDREIRKDQASHRRETCCFNRSVANGMAKLALYLIDHSYRKRYRINSGVEDERTHGEVAGVPRKKIQRILRKASKVRFFLSRLSLPKTLERVWRKDFVSPGIISPLPLPAYALA